jgi:hypothetical protein
LIDDKVRQCAWIFCTVTLYGELDMREEILSNLAGFENILLLILGCYAVKTAGYSIQRGSAISIPPVQFY